MITHKNVLTVPEVSCHSLQEVEGGYVIRYMIRNPGETAWRPVKVFRATEQDTMPHEGHRGTDRGLNDCKSSEAHREPLRPSER